MGIEPTTSAWEADVLPLNYIRKSCEQVCKPGSVFDDYLSRPYITARFKPPPNTGTSGRLSLHEPIRCCFGWGLHGRCVTAAPVSSYLAFPPLPAHLHRKSISVALSLESPPPGVTRHPALRSPDFPRENHFSRNHLTYSTLLFYHCFCFLSRLAPL